MSLMPNENLRLRSDYPGDNKVIEIESLRHKLEMAEACLASDNALIAGLKNDIAEKDAEIERLTLEHASAYKLVDYWNKKSSTIQAREQQLQDALRELLCYNEKSTWIGGVENGYSVPVGSAKLKVISHCEEILSIQSDTAALQVMIAKAGEVMRERCVDVIGPYGNTRYLSSYEEGCEDTKVGIDTKISALPPITLEDLQK